MAFMYRSLYSKFAQNEVIHEQLMQTGNRYLIYATDDDKTWGIGIDRSGKWNNIYNNGTVVPRVSGHLRPSAQRPDTRECPDMRDSKRTPIFW